MSDHIADSVTVAALLKALRPLVAELVEEEFERHDHHADRAQGGVEYLTTGEYAARFKTTPGAVLARIRRGTLKAVRPPGSREWLVPVNHHGYDDQQQAPATRERPGA